MGIEMSIRDQREGTSLSDRVEGSVSLEYIHSVEYKTAILIVKEAMSWVGWR